MIRRLAHWFWQQPYLLLPLTFLAWAINIVVGRAIAGQIPPIALAQIRWLGASAIVVPLAWRHLRQDWPEIRRHAGLLLALAASGIGVYNTLAYAALQYTEALNGLLVQSAFPLVIGLWSFLIFRDRLSAAQIVGIVLSLAGVVTIVCRGDPGLIASLTLNRGDVMMLVAVAVYALYSTLLKARPAIHPLSLLAVVMAAGAAMILPFWAWEISTGYVIRPTPVTFAVLGFVVVFPSTLAYLIFNRGVELIGPNRAGPFFHLLPVFGSALAILFLGESLRWFHLAGYALILAGIVVAQRRGTPREA
ncbi:DMT family transporter [Prosthecomicrobium pneumaticum]|uniref:Drug/metabolite transporter (DMT)-like permease n=1 Tax=Prosthecomicrobium pneumaticum TaxID=81895 RepID=A0A7W9FLA5_9HYPH|nr:DMT family transporter [Prosthecomicrobium pneumaticum]MBB5752639.1 drug/metabolite transporter (DMT)-like permease [Prosthecomicrobium pneumaticum]